MCESLPSLLQPAEGHSDRAGVGLAWDLPGCWLPPRRGLLGLLPVILQVLHTSEGAEGGKFMAAFMRSMRLSAYAEKFTEAV